MQELIQVGNAELKIKDFNGQRVITFRDIDAAHQRPDGTAKRAFSHNRKHFIKDVDYFHLEPDEMLSTNFVHYTAPKGLNLITESGYLMLVKSFTDDLAWEVQRQLVNNYFRSPKVPLALPTLQTQLDGFTAQYREAVRQFNIHLADKLAYAEKYNQAQDKVEQYDKIIRNLSGLIDATKQLIKKE